MSHPKANSTLTPEDFSPEWRDRFWSKVDTSGECWIWTGYRNPAGYGQVAIRTLPVPQKQDFTHRVVWMLTNGSIPEGMFVCHSCDNPSCVNVGHLFLGTHKENMRDMATKGRAASVTGEENGQSKLTAEQVRDIRFRSTNDGMSTRALAKDYGVSFSLIHQIVREKIWKTTPQEIAI